jgi:gluconokinase
MLTTGRPQVRIVYLRGSKSLIAARLAARTGHFMPPSLLDSQFAALEEPTAAEGAIVIDIDQPVTAQVDDIVRALGLAEGTAS